MIKCKDEKNHLIVKEYKNENVIEISKNEQICPTQKASNKKNMYLCCVCGEEHGLDHVHKIKVKGKTKNICKECADTVHGLI